MQRQTSAATWLGSVTFWGVTGPARPPFDRQSPSPTGASDVQGEGSTDA